MKPGWFARAFVALSDRLVHDHARRDRRALHTHARFIGARLLFAALICASVPVGVVLSGGLGMIGLTALAAVLATLLPALHVSRTGRLDQGQDLSSLLLSLVITVLALQSGGVGSYALLLFVIVLLDVALTGDKRSLWRGALMMACSVLALACLPQAEPARPLPIHLVGVALATYALVMAWLMVDRNERHANAQMRSQARADAALEAVADAVIWREGSGEVSYANGGAHRLLGLDRRNLSERILFERINVGDRPAFLKALSDAASDAGIGSAVVRFGVDGEGGREVRVFELIARRAEPGAGADAVVIVMRDITERQAADQLRETARREAERNATSKGQFLATMSHELRTPLNAIIGFSELLQHAELIPAGDPRRDEYARIIHSSGQHLLEVVNAILDMSKIESGMMTVEQERVDVSSVVRSSAEFLAVKAEAKSVTIQREIADDLPEIVSDRRALKQIILNLLSNAVKFSAAGGVVAVTVVRDRDMIEIAVNDSGIGISEGDLDRIGSAFFQARQSYDREHEGTGLGLSVVRGLVGLLGGEMMMESAPGEGTRVTIRLMIAGAGAAPSSEPVPIFTRVRTRKTALEPLFTSVSKDDAALRRTA